MSSLEKGYTVHVFIEIIIALFNWMENKYFQPKYFYMYAISESLEVYSVK